jgi:aldehyde dehydrogenase (NAD+)
MHDRIVTGHDKAAVLPRAALWIDNRPVLAASGGEGMHVDPATGQSLAAFPLAGASEVDAAVECARRTFPAWRDCGGTVRRDFLLAIADRLIADRERLGAIATLEGIPIAYSDMSSLTPAEWFRYYAGWADKLDGTVPGNGELSVLRYTRRVPYGVIALLTAFNAPMAFVGMKVAAALAAGNTVVLKPSDLAPWATIRFAEICREAGLPDGVVNVIQGGKEAGEALVSHPRVNRISFTGGDPTARAIMRAAANSLAPVSFELGGKSAAIIFDDADIDAAASMAVNGSVGMLTGQACIGGTRILVQRSVYAQTVERLVAAARRLPIGDPADPATIVGPVINAFHCNRIMGVIDKARASGDGRLVCGGNRVGGDLSDGYFIEPTLFADVDPEDSLAQNEVFGPVAAVIPFDTEEEAVAIANNSRYGLAGAIYSNSLGRVHRVAQSMEAGLILVNMLNDLLPSVPFGGFKTSGFGREGGHDGIMEMTQCQSLQIALS